MAPGRGTLALGAAATAALAGVVLAELRRVWRRGSAPALGETDHPLLAAEDRNFYDHGGFDIPRIAKAVWVNLAERRRSQGGPKAEVEPPTDGERAGRRRHRDHGEKRQPLQRPARHRVAVAERA